MFGLPSVLPTPRATSPRRSFALTGLVNESMRAMPLYSLRLASALNSAAALLPT